MTVYMIVYTIFFHSLHVSFTTIQAFAFADILSLSNCFMLCLSNHSADFRSHSHPCIVHCLLSLFCSLVCAFLLCVVFILVLLVFVFHLYSLQSHDSICVCIYIGGMQLFSGVHVHWHFSFYCFLFSSCYFFFFQFQCESKIAFLLVGQFCSIFLYELVGCYS